MEACCASFAYQSEREDLRRTCTWFGIKEKINEVTEMVIESEQIKIKVIKRYSTEF